MFPTTSSFFAIAKAKNWGNCTGHQHLSVNFAMGNRETNLGNLQNSLDPVSSSLLCPASFYYYLLIKEYIYLPEIMSVQCLLCYYYYFQKSSVFIQLSTMYTFIYETTAESLRTHSLLLGWVDWSQWTKGLREPLPGGKPHEFQKG